MSSYHKPYILYSVGPKWPGTWPSVNFSVYQGSSRANPEAWKSYIEDAHRAHSSGLYQSSEAVMEAAEPSMSVYRYEAIKKISPSFLLLKSFHETRKGYVQPERSGR
ncbi:hypothetical protein L486_03803 [Kwoniella mangroviensis CBS 10435]|uniref:Uncharacterized protein n=1 Tax=Kwoniella mangroviensis CBS 10435 TaxID=1331196 RepID=A0A1B9IUV4_9TREE|nr:uncharacterized protein I203_08208 [Kwoniella mangroviensis CBS 8507]OCF59300.1 hypothetical protein L486_03803 [Kwoniella mangroviensis CBS 10435]OCF62705.1 hypothetical protein I203_08208 [Kwoniella mangroviensis CBS 8507]OCF76448.1 hypothetical protein I204_02144 [Kwoniella mangroviensis CBS 8886]